ncbi:type II secretion system F family protein [Lacticaseibacillus rhamnosus]|uniref:type II secretion system F family protein n=1 Tax=Lacticaseibacillus rhamnosus TaxID=47715 RepID=UPI0019145BCD|nr:type II secretion system F family protein [Lacticaseibacillus rhamnosus]
MKVPLIVQERFCRQSAALMKAGFNLSDVFAYLQVSLPKHTAIWQGIENELANGIAFSDAVARQDLAPILFQQLQLAQVHGDLAKALTIAADYLHLRVRNRQRIVQLLVYPCLLLAMLVVLQIVVVFGVLPALSLPQSNLVALQLIGLGVVTVIGFLGYCYWHRLSPLKRLLVLQNVPGMRQLLRTYYQFQFTAGAAQFLLAGADIANFCQHLATLDGPMGKLGIRIQAKVQQGYELSVALQEPLIPAEVARLLTMGQSHHLVATGLKLFGEQLFSRLQQQLERLVSLVEPFLFLIIGGEILLVYLQILLPLYQSIGG